MYRIPVINKLLLLACFWLLLPSLAEAQQSLNYNQYMNNLTPINAAASLIYKDATINTLVRKQWVGIEGSPAMYMINGTFPIGQINAAAGFNIVNQSVTIENETQLSAFFAKSIQLAENQYLGVALIGNIYHYTANYSSLDPTDPAANGDINQTKPSAGFSILYYTNNFYAGFSVPQLSLSNLSNSAINQANHFINNYYFSSGYTAEVSDGIKIKPATLIVYTRGVPVVANVSAMLDLQNSFEIGANYRTTNDISAIFAIHVSSLRLGYSYQFSALSSNLGGIHNATHEITLGIHFGHIDARTTDSEQAIGF